MKIHLTRLINAEIALLLPTLLEHEHLSRFFNATFEIKRHEHGGEILGGKGCLRQVETRGSRFVEEITKADLSGIQYQIVGEGPLKNHQGDIHFTVVDGGTRVDYYIQGEVVGWVPDFLFTFVVKRDIAKALDNLVRHFNNGAK